MARKPAGSVLGTAGRAVSPPGPTSPKRRSSFKSRGTGSPLNSWPTRSRTATRWAIAGRNAEGSIQKSWAESAGAASRANRAARRSLSSIIFLQIIKSDPASGDAAPLTGTSCFLLDAVGAVGRARQRRPQIGEGGVELADVLERAVRERQLARGRVRRIAEDAGEGMAQDPHRHPQLDVDHVVARPATVGEAGGVTAQQTEVVLGDGGRGRGGGVEAQHLVRLAVGEEVHALDAGGEGRHQVGAGELGRRLHAGGAEEDLQQRGQRRA